MAPEPGDAHIRARQVQGFVADLERASSGPCALHPLFRRASGHGVFRAG